MQPWLWIVIIAVCAAIATGLLALVANLKKIKIKEIFKKKPKERPKKVKKSQVVAENEPAPAEPEKPKVQFVENKKQTKIELQNEQYVPSSEFKESQPAYSQIAMGGRARRRPMPRPMQNPFEDDFEDFRRRHGYSLTIKEQIENLSPEMKAILFGKVLDNKDDLF